MHYSDLLELCKQVKVEKNGDVFSAVSTQQYENLY